jgi:hypothetical protein
MCNSVHQSCYEIRVSHFCRKRLQLHLTHHPLLFFLQTDVVVELDTYRERCSHKPPGRQPVTALDTALGLAGRRDVSYVPSACGVDYRRCRVGTMARTPPLGGSPRGASCSICPGPRERSGNRSTSRPPGVGCIQGRRTRRVIARVVPGLPCTGAHVCARLPCVLLFPRAYTLTVCLFSYSQFVHPWRCANGERCGRQMPHWPRKRGLWTVRRCSEAVADFAGAFEWLESILR